jgi:23S rRNA (uracil1939-C5)-methyltransferase
MHTVTIESVDYEGNGIARIEGKTIFIAGAIAGEEVTCEIIKHKPSFAKARLISIISPSPKRVQPQCPNFGVCGGCSFQHIEFKHQVAIKQQVLVDNLKHIAKVTATEILPPLWGEPWGYRHRARLSVRFVAKKGGVLIGFRERNSSFIADMHECWVLPSHVSRLITPLRELIGRLKLKERIPQIEVALGAAVTVLVLRNMEQLPLEDQEQLIEFMHKFNSIAHPLQLWLQPHGPESCYPFYPQVAPSLSYELNSFALKMPFYPTEFTQVNPQINQEMVRLALDLLQPQADDIIADFFCGIGNFTLAIAKNAGHTIGIEGSLTLVKRAQDNAQLNNLGHKVEYRVANLFSIDREWLQQLGNCNKWLLDPPRDGALELVKAINLETAPRRIVYVSCNPATLARDAAILVQVHGYRLLKAGVMNMFPHTSHIESIALFEL